MVEIKPLPVTSPPPEHLGFLKWIQDEFEKATGLPGRMLEISSRPDVKEIQKQYNSLMNAMLDVARLSTNRFFFRGKKEQK